MAPSSQHAREPSRLARLVVNALTLGNAACGLAAILIIVHTATSPQNAVAGVVAAAALIFAGWAFDMLDGVAARQLDVAGPFGAVLDSLCDVVTFGVVPALMLVVAAQLAWPDPAAFGAALVVAALFGAAVLLRLARFTAAALGATGAPPKLNGGRFFAGMSSPAGAMMVASAALLHAEAGGLFAPPTEPLAAPMMIIFALIAAPLMVSNLPFPHLPLLYFGRHLPRWHLLVPVVVAILIGIPAMLVLAFTLYILTGPAFAWRRRPRSPSRPGER